MYTRNKKKIYLFSFQEDGLSENEMDEEVMKPIWDLTDLTKKSSSKGTFPDIEN